MNEIKLLEQLLCASNSKKHYGELRKLAEYLKDYRDDIHQKTKDRHMPFEDLFQGKDRIYEDFSPIVLPNQSDKVVKESLELEGYKITNYQKGLALPPSGSSNQSEIRIGKALEKIRDSYGLSILNLKHKNSTKEQLTPITLKWVKLKSAIETFKASPIRASKNEQNSKLQIVYTRNTDDIATMSTEKPWRSCLDLNDELNNLVIIEEIMAGGIVAYVIKSEDKDIQHPLARILIRRVKSNSDLGIKMAPEHAVYGIPVQGFMRTVINFAEKYNQNIEGSYQLLGGTDWSDSISKKYNINPSKINLKEYIDKIKSIENNETEDLRLKEKTDIVHSFHTLKELSFKDVIDIYFNLDDMSYLFPKEIRRDNIKAMIATLIKSKISNRQEAEANRPLISKLINHLHDDFSLRNDFFLKESLQYIYMNYLMTERSKMEIALQVPKSSFKFRVLDVTSITPNVKELVNRGFNISHSHNLNELRLILNSISKSTKRAYEVMAGSELTNAESSNLILMASNRYNPKDAINELLKSISSGIEPNTSSLNNLLEAFSNNKDKTYIRKILKTLVDDSADENEGNMILPELDLINLKTVKKLRNDPDQQTRFLARELFRIIRFVQNK